VSLMQHNGHCALGAGASQGGRTPPSFPHTYPHTVLFSSCNTHTGKDQIERLLALGASRYEATADLVGRSVRLAMTPLLNTMSVVGLVSIPGVCTAP
jgi:hypothetical protein